MSAIERSFFGSFFASGRFRYVVSRGFIGRRVVIRLLVFVNYSACVSFGR